MKFLLQIILIFIVVKSFSQEKEIISKADSLIIRDDNIASNPFNFGRDPLSYLLKVKLSNRVIEKDPVANRHVDNQVDTTYGIKFGADKFNVYKQAEENSLLAAEIKTNRFLTKQGIKVGMNKSQVISLLKDYWIKKIPRYLILENSEMTEYLVLEFKKEILIRIKFEGYFD